MTNNYERFKNEMKDYLVKARGKGRWIRVIFKLSNTQAYGKVNKMGGESFYLKPSAIYEETTKTGWRLEENLEAIVSFSGISAIQPVSDKFIKRLLEGELKDKKLGFFNQIKEKSKS